ncbi:glutamate mutase L [Ruminococcaceae bacterium OttesenSCG-928-D13]|nr:glutamate mutase L [Ruminococcaceae bacterium OttesenSCG-928-D13]
MKVDILVAEIGSTTTVVNAFNGIDTENPAFIGQGQAPTTVLDAEGVTLGLQNAVDALAASLGEDKIEWGAMEATSSAAGGLRMTVHGLVYDMTVRAAKEAALGAGANLHLTTAGVLNDHDLSEVERINPNLILLAGGTDYGERETALENARLLTTLTIRPPVIYAGNVQNQAQIKEMLTAAGFKCTVVENVYPRLDELNIEPTRKAIHRVFEEHITKAPGMGRVREMVSGTIMPTPGAVMECSQLMYGALGDLLVIDVGGATTDVHSVTEGSEEIALMTVAPEPRAKRTVEGDLGLYVNARTVIELVGEDEIAREAGIDLEAVMQRYQPIPADEEQLKLAQALGWHAASTALARHAGNLRYIYGPSGRQTLAEGKDLTKVRWLIGTGGALTRMPGREAILTRLRDLNASGRMLLPKPERMRVLQDNDYIMASLGALSVHHPKAATALMQKSLGVDAATIQKAEEQAQAEGDEA